MSTNAEKEQAAERMLECAEDFAHNVSTSLLEHDETYQPRRRSSRLLTALSSPLILHLFAFIAYAAPLLLLTNFRLFQLQQSRELIPLSARKALIWELRHFPTKLKDNPFAGDPRSELDHAWHELLQNDNIRLPTQDLKALDLTSVYLADGSGQIASLSVFHSLHCLKKVRHMVHRDYYHSKKDDEQMRREESHVDHCVEYLREALMCKPDLSLVTFSWINNTAQHPDDPSALYPTNGDRCLHECANWNALNSWAGERRFDLSRIDELRKPAQGLEYEGWELG